MDGPVQLDLELCKACGVCKKECPAGAIRGEKKKSHSIDAAACIHCGICYEVCKFQSVERE